MGEGNPPGGSLELARLIDRHGESLIPDLKHYYGIDLRELFSEVDPLSPGWVLLHVKNLPLGSSFVADVRGGSQFRGWNEDRYMTATLINAIKAVQYILILANSDPKKSKARPPEPYPLPDKNTQKKTDAPGSFAFIANSLIAKAKKQKEGR